jgi:hypothetical protein
MLRCILELWITIPLLLTITYWWINSASRIESSLINGLLSYYRSIYINTLTQRGVIFFLDNAFLYPDIIGRLISCFFSLVVLLPFCWQITLHGTGFLKKHSLMIPVYVFSICSFLAFLFIPESSEGIIYFWYQRFTVFFYIAIIIIFSASLQSLHKINRAAICLICLAHFVLWMNYYRDFDRENTEFTESFLPEPAPGKKLAGIMMDNDFRDAPIYLHFPSYYIVWKHGIATTSLIDSGFGSYLTTKRKTSVARLPAYDPWVNDQNYCQGEYKNMDYLLVRKNRDNKELNGCDTFFSLKNADKWFIYQLIK